MNTKSKSSTMNDRHASHHKRKTDGAASTPSQHGKKRLKKSGSASDTREKTAHLGRSASARVLAQRRREARRGGAERLTSSLLRIWEKMRVASTSNDEKLRLAKDAIRALNRDDGDDDDDAHAKMTKTNTIREDRWKKACGSHRASRVIQAVFKYGGQEERAEACMFVTQLAPELVLDRYGHFVVLRALDHVKKNGEGREKLVSVLTKSSLTKTMARNTHGSSVLAAVCATVGADKKKLMCNAFFESGEVRLGATGRFETGTGSYSSVSDLFAAEPKRRSKVLEMAASAVRPCLEKKLLDAWLVHAVLALLVEHGGVEALEDMRDNLSGPSLMRIVHSREGCRVACAVVAAAGAKERKALVKAIKPQVATIARDEYGHVLIAAILRLVDDTVLVAKNVLGPLIAEADGGIGEIMAHKYARFPILDVLAPSCRRYLSDDKRSLLVPPKAARKTRRGAAAIAADNVDDDDDDDEDDDDDGGSIDDDEEKQRSLKDPKLRRSELLSRAPSSLGSALLSSVASEMDSYMQHGFAGSDVVFECVCGGEDGILMTAVNESDVRRCGEALVKHIEETSNEGTDVLGEYFMSRLLKRVLIARTSSSQFFAEELFRRCIKGKSAVLSKTHAGKVVAALFVSGLKTASLKLLREELVTGGITSADASSIDAWTQKMGVTMNRTTPSTSK